MKMIFHSPMKYNDLLIRSACLYSGITYQCSPCPLRISIVIGYFIPCLDIFNCKQAKMRFILDCQLFHSTVWAFVSIIDQSTQWTIFMGGINAEIEQWNMNCFSSKTTMLYRTTWCFSRSWLTTMCFLSIQNQTGNNFASLCTFSVSCLVHSLRLTLHGTQPQRTPFDWFTCKYTTS